MLINKDIRDIDKIVLNKLGKDADTPITDLLTSTQYRRKSSIYNRIRYLKGEKYLFGPYFDVNYNAIGTNKLYSVFVFAHYAPMYRNTVLEAMRKINCWTMIYPVRTADAYLGIYRCNNWNYIASLFGMMSQWGWLCEYSVQKSECRWIKQNPDFFGEFIPPPDYQAAQETLPAYEYEDIEVDFELTKTDLIILKHLSRKTCHLTEIRDLEYRYYGLKLKYHDLKRCYEKLRKTKILLKKQFLIYPLPQDMCSRFFLVSEGKNLRSHLTMIANFGNGFRLTKEFMAVGKGVISYFTAHPLLEARILGLLENDVRHVDIYGVKTYPTPELLVQTLNDDYFDVDSQRWIFPYSTFKKELRVLKEKREGISL
jgi:DNA-binding Lrp family transcriptional regulator